MKKLFLTLIFLILLSVRIDNASALTTKTPTPTESVLQQQVDELKSKIASKVAELNLVEKRAFFGTVTDVSDTQITLKDIGGNTKFVDVDELTKFSSANSKSFGISDIENNMTLGVLGLYNKQSRRLLARVVNEENKLPQFIYGAVYSLDSKEFTITVAKENGARNVVDIETVTKTFSYEEGKLVKSGFSQIKGTESIIVIGFLDDDDKKTITASRIILLPEIMAGPDIDLGPQDEDLVPSTGSGKKLTPIKQPSTK
ncbi:MAG: hypothetical protein COU25_02740 [Candidatus Levybacteria bacterium CG10_big_fil_rev_8_21_14_0_10_35_13]|nr:MAG: hypothetical protein COU25_02740 [Candidatus Levybacteria bacterium CG10_big_fil_rev_8_21_14_0_10_35_13]